MDDSSNEVETGDVAGGVEPRLGGACHAWDNVDDDLDSHKCCTTLLRPPSLDNISDRYSTAGRQPLQNTEGDQLNVKRMLRNFGIDIREARRRTGLSQRQLGQRLGVTQSYVSLVELGERNLSLTAITAFARVLGYDASIALTFSHPQRDRPE